MDYIKLVEQIKEVFATEDKFIMKKAVEEFEKDDKFLGDFYTFLIYEDMAGESPRLYQVGGPFDLISGKAPQQALIWQEGKLLLNVDFTEFVDIRTGAMDSLIVGLLGKTISNNSRVLVFGTGKTAFWSIKILKHVFKDLKHVDYVNSSNTRDADFEQKLSDEDLILNPGNVNEIGNYDYVFCHTNTKKQLLTKDLMSKLKDGALITTFISSTENGEVDDDFYSDSANVILDWEKNMEKGADLSRAIKSGLVSTQNIITIKDLIDAQKIDKDKPYTIFRSVGTPMQNLAVLKLLAKE